MVTTSRIVSRPTQKSAFPAYKAIFGDGKDKPAPRMHFRLQTQRPFASLLCFLAAEVVNQPPQSGAQRTFVQSSSERWSGGENVPVISAFVLGVVLVKKCLEYLPWIGAHEKSTLQVPWRTLASALMINFVAAQLIHGGDDGCCGIIVVVSKDHIFSANVGTCHAILQRGRSTNVVGTDSVVPLSHIFSVGALDSDNYLNPISDSQERFKLERERIQLGSGEELDNLAHV